jgi:hypothetical protein
MLIRQVITTFNYKRFCFNQQDIFNVEETKHKFAIFSLFDVFISAEGQGQVEVVWVLLTLNSICYRSAVSWVNMYTALHGLHLV